MNFKVIENILKQKHMIPQLKVLEKQYSTPVVCYHQDIDPDEFEAFSTNSHSFETTPHNFNAILGLSDFHQTDLFSSSGFESIVMYTSSSIPKSGDKIQINSEESTAKNYIIDKIEQYGTELNVFYRIMLSGIEE